MIIKRSEHSEQVAVIDWCNRNAHKYPELGLIFAIPNGGQRNKITAMKLKAEGVKAGIPDLFLPVPVLNHSALNNHCGLFIEMKFGKNKPTAKQKEWLEKLREAGYFVAVCYSAEEAIAAIKDYLRI